MPDGASVILSGVYWVATGKLPGDEVKDNIKDQGKDASQLKNKKGR